MVSDDTTTTESGATDTPKRGRIFGARSRKRASSPERAVETTPEPPVTEEQAAEEPAPAEPDQVAQPQQPEPEQPAEQSGQQDDAEQQAAPEQPAETDQGSTQTPSGPAFPELKAESTTSLLFFAPPPEVLAPARATRDDSDDDETGAAGNRRRRRRSRGASGDVDTSARTSDDSDDDEDDSSDRGSSRTRSRGRGRTGSARREPEMITEPQRIKGSTRLEAKKQRRRDGRDAGRRRPVVTEAEFLARRESVDRVMVVRSKENRIQIGVLEDGVLVEHYVARSSESSLIGNVYLGKVQNVLPSMEAAFVDIGRGRNAVLYSGEVDWDAAAEAGEKNQPRRIELALKPGDKVLVQVTKDPIGHKGARLTSQVSLPGRYLVYVPNGSMSGISRKLPDTERARLKKILKEVLPENVGVIVRTAAEGATEEQLTLDVNRLTNQWAEISKQVATANAPALLHSEPDLLVKIVRDVFNEDFRSMVISGADAQQTIESYLRGVAPDLLDRIEKHDGEHDPFDEYRITEQIEKALERKVWLPSGGSLVIDRTEAMTVVDVNTGKFVGSGGNLEETVTKNNLEAAEELVRQLRLRDIGGIIVVDFIDMVLESNRDLVLRRLMECLSRDRTKHQVAEVTSLGLVQMTRKRIGLGLLETFSENCEVCAGRGVIVHHDPVVKHRGQNGDSGRNRRGGGGNTGSNGGGRGGSSAPKNGTSTGTHAITEDVSKALATIAAKTVHHDAPVTTEIPVQDAGAAHAPATEAPAAESTTSSNDGASTPRDADQQSGETAQRSGNSGRRGRRGKRASTESAQPAASSESQESASEVPILDIPVPVVTRPRTTVDSTAAQQLLGSVLESLPEPPAPGTRKRASRRVSSGTITTAQGGGDTQESSGR